YKFYMCSSGNPVTLKCPSNLFFSPITQTCEWSKNVECGTRVVPGEENVNTGPCNCDPKQALSLCAQEGSNGKLVAHNVCSHYHMCVSGKTLSLACPSNLFYDPQKERCDFPANVSCEGRVAPVFLPPLNKHLEARQNIRHYF
ncbi:chitin binding domain-containing protein, partial [Chitinophaga agrisoli]